MSPESAARWVAQYIGAAFWDEPAPSLNEAADWQEIISTARAHGLAPLLYAALRRSAHNTTPSLLGPEIPHAALEQLHNLYRQTALANAFALHALGELLDECTRYALPVIVLKGAALAMTLYPESAWRPFGDLDLLIRKKDKARLDALLRGRGFEPIGGTSGRLDDEYSGQICYARGGTEPLRLEVHSALLARAYYRQRAPVEWFWQHTVETNSGSSVPTRSRGESPTRPYDGQCARRHAVGRLRVFDPMAQLLYLAAHLIFHHRPPRLIWLYDLNLLLRHAGAQIDWDELLARAREFGWVLPLRMALAETLEWWKAPVPSDWFQELCSPRESLREKAVFALATAPQSDARLLADGLDLASAPTSLRYWFHQLFPSREYMRRRYRLPCDTPNAHGRNMLLALSYARRVATALARVIRLLLAVAR